MASAYTTKRGKNKKGKLGDRKDANNNAANKLSQKMFAENPLEFLSKQSLEPRTLGNSATARKREALESARASLNLLLTGACGNGACPNGAQKDASKQLLLCQGCRSKAYCDAVCQKAHWKDHKAECKETAAKKAAAEEEAKSSTLSKKDKSGKAEAPSAASSSAAPLAITAALAAATITPAAELAAAAAAAPAPAAATPAADATPAAAVDASSLD